MLMNTHEARLDALRKELARQGLDGFVVPISDEHMSEYVGGYAQRLEWLTGYGGSAGTAVVLTDATLSPAAAMFVDGRYTLQVRDQVDGRFYAYENVPQTSVAKWLSEHAPEGARIGYDAWLHGKGWAAAAGKALEARGGALVAVESNPIDVVWQDRPAPSPAPAIVHDDDFAGQSSQAKREALSAWLAEQKLDAAVISALDSIAWLLNIRGQDVERTPVALSYVLAHADGTAELFIAPEKVTTELTRHLGNAVRIEPRDAFVPALQGLKGKRVAVDPERAVAAIFAQLEQAGAHVVETRDPTVLPKAVKNPVEQQGHRNAQVRDGAAVSRFLRWLESEGPKGTVTEMSAADALQEFRRQTGDLRDLSFDTISGAGPNGAVVHYRVSEETNRTLEPGSVYLVDSGGQYPDGTTDITRTVWIGHQGGGGEPSAEVKDRFTRVLKGHIALAQAVFPQGTAGHQLDVLARQYLWAAGLDYAHGTGHGVGSFLSVHEGPQRIAKSAGGQAGTDQELIAGMFLSNEPGYYKTGEYGIRIENLVLVEARDIPGAEGSYLGFETLTLVPIDAALVDVSLLTPLELGWWNTYHARVLEVVGPQLDEEERAWLEERCRPLS
ncbi:Xaa-Pro aminopeptidase [Novosphingobium chloroacetimidivorans]|uniref:Xaa-Pro aminopeptidase n=1 Tax=Novosphingobium chloroacetimidivorans TaxID=1428314 RepID=A0A7W7K846_9SPHN|nr:aminopeptidase P family protein [Novosphingobium chloroacetimidivorans]MBB4857323.1 Xaa-Pro aminopeptidase [Novosphingobium chloroacetimidivorans]